MSRTPGQTLNAHAPKAIATMPDRLPRGPGALHAGSIGSADEHIYWVEADVGAGGSLMRAGLDGGGVAQVLGDLGSPFGVALYVDLPGVSLEVPQLSGDADLSTKHDVDGEYREWRALAAVDEAGATRYSVVLDIKPTAAVTVSTSVSHIAPCAQQLVVDPTWHPELLASFVAIWLGLHRDHFWRPLDVSGERLNGEGKGLAKRLG